MSWEQFVKESSTGDGEALAAEIITKYNAVRSQNLEKLAQLEGEVVAHSMVSALRRFKAASVRGLCWECSTRSPEASSSYGRCTECEANDE